MRADIEEILYSEEALNARLTELGEQITNDYAGKPLTVISILKGSNIFTSDLVRKINLPLKMDFMAVSSYGSVEGENLLIVEDIVDSGLTLKYLKEILLTRNPASVKICTLLDKPARRKESVNIDYLGFEVPDGFIVGYGIDYAERYRNLPYVGILKRSVYEK